MTDLSNVSTEALIAEITRRGSSPRCRCRRWSTYLGSYDSRGEHVALPRLPQGDRRMQVHMTTPVQHHEWRYLPGGSVVHALRSAGDRRAQCGIGTWTGEEWMGTGSQREYERAERLRECKHCHRITRGRR